MFRSGWLHWWILPNIQRKTYINPSWAIEDWKRLKEKGTLSKTFKEATIILISKLDKDTTKKRKLPVNILDEYRCKSPHKILANWMQQYV